MPFEPDPRPGGAVAANVSPRGEMLFCARNVPLGLPFLVLLVPTLLLWRRDRREHRPGFCRRCNYDLTANTSGVCPECRLEIAGLGWAKDRNP